MPRDRLNTIIQALLLTRGEFTMNKAQQAYNFITGQLADGKTVNIATAMKIFQITPKIAAQWHKVNRQLFKIGDDGCLYMASGKSYVCIAYKELVLCKISASHTIGSK